MSSEENSSNSSSNSSILNELTFSQRVDDFSQWHERNMQLNHLLEGAVNSHIIQQQRQQQNSIPRAIRRYIDRHREEGKERLFNDNFAENLVYNDRIFCRRFRMRKHVFLRLVDAITISDDYFNLGQDASGRNGLTSLQKFTAPMRILAYGSSSNAVDEYLRMSAIVVRECVSRFARGVISNFGNQYLRRPNEQDLHRLLQEGERHGFPGMMGSIDCMHWEWKNCPTAWAGQYARRSKKATIILEVVASWDLWIWHAFFGTPGSLNDINVLQRSPVFDDIIHGQAPAVSFYVNGHEYNMGYYLTDGIYPNWATFVKSITAPQLRKHKLFATYQESVRKDVERAFGVLQARFAIIKQPCRVWDKRLMGKILMACIIMHNMIVEDERDTYQNYHDTSEFVNDRLTRRNATIETGEETAQPSHRETSQSRNFQITGQIRNRGTHEKLKNDLIEHIWQNFRNVN